MTPHYSDAWLDIYQGDVRDVLPQLASDSVDCIVTSPPYWGLRDYGTAAWDGGDAECDHSTPRSRGDDIREGDKQGTSAGSRPNTQHTCGKCGAIRQDSQLGLERTPEEYVANLVAVFRELRRVLKPSGTCWLNLGDSYSSHAAGVVADPMAKSTLAGVRTQIVANGDSRAKGRYRTSEVLPEKNLVGIPWRVAFALQADGWYLRSDIIWAKPNPMPESVTDRPTKSHEYLFLLTKSARYYFDADAVREANTNGTLERARYAIHGIGKGDKAQAARGDAGPAEWSPYGRAKPGTYEAEAFGENPHSERRGPKQNFDVPANGRNLRSVWNIATRPYPGAHFAVFPPELPERCIKAGSSERGVCPDCGAPWERVVERTPGARFVEGRPLEPSSEIKATLRGRNVSGQEWARSKKPDVMTGWRPACACEKDGGGWVPQPAVVLDPFAGSGTTGLVANRLSRRAILIDLNADYLRQMMKRNAQMPVGL